MTSPINASGNCFHRYLIDVTNIYDFKFYLNFIPQCKDIQQGIAFSHRSLSAVVIVMQIHRIFDIINPNCKEENGGSLLWACLLSTVSKIISLGSIHRINETLLVVSVSVYQDSTLRGEFPVRLCSIRIHLPPPLHIAKLFSSGTSSSKGVQKSV